MTTLIPNFSGENRLLEISGPLPFSVRLERNFVDLLILSGFVGEASGDGVHDDSVVDELFDFSVEFATFEGFQIDIVWNFEDIGICSCGVELLQVGVGHKIHGSHN